VIIHLTAADLPADTGADGAPPHTSQPSSAERTTDGPPRPYAHIVGGPGLPDSVVQRLTCAGRIRTALQNQDGTMLDLGRSHRLVSDRLYRALLLRDDGCCCTYPGCANTRDLEAHHVRHWLHGGPTNLAKLVLLLCAGHHRAHHDGEFRIQPLGRGRFRFLRADGRLLPDHVDPGQLTQDPTPVETNMLTSPPTRPPSAGSATASTGPTPSASWPNTENNRPLGPADKFRPR